MLSGIINRGWIESSGVITDPTTVRVIASRTDDAVIVMSIADDGIAQELIITHQIRRYRQSDTANGAATANRIYIETAILSLDLRLTT